MPLLGQYFPAGHCPEPASTRPRAVSRCFARAGRVGRDAPFVCLQRGKHACRIGSAAHSQNQLS